MARMAGIAAKAEKLTGLGVIATTPIAGGDICTATRLRLTDGRSAVMKTRPGAPDGFFLTEAEGLRWLQEGGAAGAEVIAAAADCLIVEWIEPSRPNQEAAERLGHSLASTHRSGSEVFGAHHDGFIGLAPLPNRPADTWAEFYAARRVMPYVRSAVDRGRMSSDDAWPIETLMERINEFAPPEEAPARIHGDLWSGNVVWGASGEAYLIDPAAHGGHRETDLAMLSLFGAPHLQQIQDSYNEVFPLADGWQDRVGLHQLHPLLV